MFYGGHKASAWELVCRLAALGEMHTESGLQRRGKEQRRKAAAAAALEAKWYGSSCY